MVSRQSKSTVGPSLKTLLPACSLDEAQRQVRHDKDQAAECLWIRECGDKHVQEVVELDGEETDGAGASTCENAHEAVVALNEQAENPKKKRARKQSKAWSVTADLQLMTVAYMRQVWRMPGGKSVKHKWRLAHEDLEREPFFRIFGSKPRSNRESRFDQLVRAHRVDSSNAARSYLEGDHAKLEKVLIAIVDEKDAIKLDNRGAKEIRALGAAQLADFLEDNLGANEKRALKAAQHTEFLEESREGSIKQDKKKANKKALGAAQHTEFLAESLENSMKQGKQGAREKSPLGAAQHTEVLEESLEDNPENSLDVGVEDSLEDNPEESLDVGLEDSLNGRREKRNAEELEQRCKQRKLEIDAERQLRADERADARRAREAREDRRDAREAARRQDAKDKRDHELAMMRLKVELAKLNKP